MRIVLFTDADVFAGTERHILDLAIALKGEGGETGIACPGRSPLAERARVGGVEVFPIEKGRRFIDPGAIKAVLGLLKSGAADVIHAHNGRTLLTSAVAVKLCGAGRCVATQHFINPSRAGRSGVTRMISQLAHRWVAGNVDHFVAISSAVRDAILRRGEAPANRVSVIPNGLVIERPDIPTAHENALVRRGLLIPPDAQLIFCAARLEKEKAIGTLIEAMKVVRAAHPLAICAIAGEGAERTALEGLIEREGLQNAVRLLGFRSDVRSIMSAADVFALPSVAEPFGLALIEAMSVGRAVVATRAGGPLEIVEPEQTGLLVEPHDAKALAGALCRLLGEPDLCNRMGIAGLRRFQERYTARRMARETMAVYRRILSPTDVAKARP